MSRKRKMASKTSAGLVFAMLLSQSAVADLGTEQVKAAENTAKWVDTEYVVNGDFESSINGDGSITGWTKSTGSGLFVTKDEWAKNNTTQFTKIKDITGDNSLSQTIKNVEPGTYRISIDQDGQKDVKSGLYVKYLEQAKELPATTDWDNWETVTTDEFTIEAVQDVDICIGGDVAIGYDDEILSEPISLDVKKMDAIAIVGPNGIGKTTFIKSVVGKLPFIKGMSTYGANVEVGYYDQTQSALTPSNTVLDELWNDFATTPEVEIRNRLGAFLFSGDDVKKSVSMLSGGEKARLLLAKLSMENNNFLILDEPTNHLDIDSKEVLENALIDFDGTLLFVSHDRYFINRVATKVMEISEDGATIYLGDYDYYLEKKAELEELARLEAEENQVSEEVQVASAGASDYQAQKANQKEMRKLSRRIEQIENELETIEERLEEISAAMLETNDVAELSDLQKELDGLSVNQEALMEEWSDLSEQLEG